MAKRRTASLRQPSTVETDIIRGLTAFRDTLREGRKLEERFTVTRPQSPMDPPVFDPDGVRSVRRILGAERVGLAHLLGVSESTVLSWEEGRRRVPKMARWLLDEMQKEPARWRRRLHLTRAA